MPSNNFKVKRPSKELQRTELGTMNRRLKEAKFQTFLLFPLFLRFMTHALLTKKPRHSHLPIFSIFSPIIKKIWLLAQFLLYLTSTIWVSSRLVLPNNTGSPVKFEFQTNMSSIFSISISYAVMGKY